MYSNKTTSVFIQHQFLYLVNENEPKEQVMKTEKQVRKETNKVL